MKRWYLASSVMVILSIPTALMAQQGGGNGMGGGNNGGRGTGNTSGGLAGTANTTLLGNQIDLNFNSVFGNNATIANTNNNVFAAYQPAGSGSGSNTGSSSFSGGSGITNSGLGTGSGGIAGGLGGNTGNRGATGTGLNAGGQGGVGGFGGGGLTSGGLGGGLGGGGLGANRGGLGGGLTTGGFGGGLGGNRNIMGGGNLGGGGFLGGTGGFLGGAGMNNQQNATQATMGFQVNYEGKGAAQLNIAPTLIAQADFQQRLLASPGMQSASGLQVFTRGDTAVLRGQVGSDYARQLAAAMIRLEPGVYDVQNELVVAPPKQ